MRMDAAMAMSYLRSPDPAPWHWGEGGAVVVWRDGGTVAFREEIRLVLEALAPRGLPPFGAVVLLLAACRSRVPGEDEVRGWAAGKGAGAPEVRLALDQLLRVSRMPGELNAGVRARCMLAEAVFEEVSDATRRVAAPVLAALRDPMDVEALAGGGPGDLLGDLFLVARGLRRHTAESLAVRLRTGLDALPESPGPDGPVRPRAPEGDRARRWLEELGRDSELGAVARAAKDLMAALRLPRRLGESQELAAGGVADLSQRGSLDRLLLSELAHDDLTLAVRVALNEALYLRREPPKRDPPGGVSILLDAGIRTWGVPRLLTLSVALAVVANEGRGEEVQVWRAKGNGVAPVDLMSREGLVSHLGALETAPHVGDALAKFGADAGGQPGRRFIVVTHADATGDPEFIGALGALAGLDAFLGVVDRDGRFALHRLPWSGRTPVAAADLDLGRVLAKPESGSPLVVEEETDLPAIFRLGSFPFLLPVAGRVTAWCRDALERSVVVLANRQVARFGSAYQGAEYLPVDLPAGRTLGVVADEVAVWVVKGGGRSRPARLFQLRAGEDRASSVDLPAHVLNETYDEFRVHGDVLLLLGQRDVGAASTCDGRWLGSAARGFSRIHGRFYRTAAGTIVAAGWDGEAISMDPVPPPVGWSATDICMVFDRHGMPGPWVVRRGGLVRGLSGGTDLQLPVPGPYRELDVRVSPDGHRVAWSLTPGKVSIRDLRTGADVPCRAKGGGTVDLNSVGPVPSRNLYRVVHALGVVEGGLAFLGRGQRWRRVSPEVPFQVREVPGKKPQVAHEVPCAGTFVRTRFGCGLARLEWPSGSVAWIDDRGLLHLRPETPGAPETSILLAEGEVAAWTSEGGLCGHPFFLGKAATDGEGVRRGLVAFLDSL